MSDTPPVSLVIVSRDRAAGLTRLISALRFQSYGRFEVVVVSNYRDTSFLNQLPGADSIRHVFMDAPNISQARNLGIVHSAGDIIVFCDDDAVPEPRWLERLVAPFKDEKVASTGGFVRGRNGIDFQWQAIKCDRAGEDYPVKMDAGANVLTMAFDGTYFAKVQGTNCAFRANSLCEIGGFDENYRFFLDETDVALTLALAGWSTAIVPQAEVQHGFAESAERTRNRVPKTLKNIGASKVYFMAKFGADQQEKALETLRHNQHCRLLRLMRDGFLGPGDVRRLLATLEEGINVTPKIDKIATPLERIPVQFTLFRKSDVCREPLFVAVAGNVAFAKKMQSLAQELLMQGNAVTVFRFTYTSLFHKRFFDVRGFWVQAGGLFGRSTRQQPMFWFGGTRKRVNLEIEALSGQRQFVGVKTVRFF